jgi:hypothetical protein
MNGHEPAESLETRQTSPFAHYRRVFKKNSYSSRTGGRRIHIEIPMLRILIYLHPAAQTTRGSTATPEQRGELRATTMS